MIEPHKVGIALPLSARVPSAADLIDQIGREVEAAETAGFGLCMIPEHRQGPEVSIGSPLTIAASLATRTSRIRIATSVLLAAVHHPVHLAEQLTTLDHLSRGRFILGVGAGYQLADLSPFGLGLGDRVGRLEDAMRGVRALMQQPAASYDGPTVSFSDVAVRPPPFTVGGPPIWLGTWSGKGITRAADLADGWIADPIRPTSDVARVADAYRQACERSGARPKITVMREAWVDDDDEVARQRFANVIVPIYRYYRRRGAYTEGPADGSGVHFDALTDRLICGSPATCIQQIEAVLEATGADYVALHLRHPAGPDHARTVEVIEELGCHMSRSNGRNSQ